ncbi:nucleotidyltransferase family protein [Roseiflexus castenholzii]|uniref:nucleotidyltransferase family protein n=1 Tax=Roseiflexus castenholzii TaxID=120962 RepID=UPI003C7B5F54
MKTLAEIRAILADHREELRERFGVKSLALFGSCVRGEQGAESDVDIMVEFDRPVGWEVVDLRGYLEEILGMRVDLVTKGALMRKPLLWQAVQEELTYV